MPEPHHARDADPDSIRRVEWMLFAALGLLLPVIRLIALFHHRVNSDEPQHLHVAWGWSQGLLQYRDVFDNHAPLFHMLSAPLVAFLGERPDIVIRMRAPMLLFWIVTVLSTFCVARHLYSLRAACWTVAIVSVYPPFFLKSLEYRTDNLWSALWMLAMALLLTGTSTARRALAGFVLGCAVCTSMKTLLLLGALAIASLLIHFLFDRRSMAVVLRCAAPPAAAFLIPPLALGAFFYLHGAWRPMLYCVFAFNFIAARTRPHAGPGHVLYPVCMLLMILLAARIARRSGGSALERDRMWVGFLVATFFVTTQAFWPILSQRDYLAVMPLIAMFLAALALDRRWGAFSTPALAALTLVFLISLFRDADLFRNRAHEHIALMQQALDLTRPGDCVMDLKGETVYRPRPFYYALETVARSAISSRLIADTIPEAVIASRCHVAGGDAFFFPPRARAFLTANFLDLGTLRASGQWIRSDGSFSVAVPGRYVIAGRNGLARGLLDGVPHAGPVSLHAGDHRFVRAAPGERVACFWAEAFERGYSPFR